MRKIEGKYPLEPRTVLTITRHSWMPIAEQDEPHIKETNLYIYSSCDTMNIKIMRINLQSTSNRDVSLHFFKINKR